MDISKFSGLTSEEVSEKESLGLSNTTLDTKIPSFIEILLRHVFTISNLALIPLLLALLFFNVYRDVIVLTFFILTSALTQTFEEMRVKKRLEGLRDKFKSFANVIREGKLIEITSDKIVKEDLIFATEGETILTDGEILSAEYLQIDESALTGESDYISKKEANSVLSGSFVVTGSVVYKATGLGKQNYLNRLETESTKFENKRSTLEINSTRIVYIFTAIGFLTAALNFIFARINGFQTREILIGITTVMGNATPQMLLIILLVTFIISVAKLANKGILVQKRGSIDELAGIDAICMDKTGTITTNEMIVVDTYLHNLTEEDLKNHFNPIHRKLYGVNKTAKTIFEYLNLDNDSIDKTSRFDQVPFTSDNKYSISEYMKNSVVLGAVTKVKKYLDKSLHNEVTLKISEFEKKGYRVLFGVFLNENIIKDKVSSTTDKYFIFAIEETLNPGIQEVLKTLQKQNIQIKIISGDSLESVRRIVEKIGISSKDIIDLSEFKGKIEDIVDKTIVFTRAVPSDKSKIVNSLKNRGLKVAMIGDGVNDVLSLKKSDVSIAMESGAKVARDVSDIVLLNNDYKKIPEIFYEGDNIIFNIKLTAKTYFARAVTYGVIALFFTFVLGSFVPINPTSTLISSFLGNTLVSYLLTFSRDEIKDQRNFMKDIIFSSIPSGILIGLFTIFIYKSLRNSLDLIQLNTAMILGILGMSMSYTLFLLWKSGKISKNIFLVIGAFLIGMFIGVLQTVLPIWQIENYYDQVFVVVLVALGCILLHFIIRYAGTVSSSKNVERSSFILPTLLFLIAIIFPAREYYAVWPVPLQYFSPIILSIILFIIIMTLIHAIIIDPILENEIKNKSKNKFDYTAG